MRIKLWGTRGSIATPEVANAGYGGSTPCVEVEAADGELFILDAGIGIHFLGDDLQVRGHADGGRRGHLMLTHLHWGHIQGIPFFLPLLLRENRFRLYGAGGGALEARLRQQMNLCYCPVPNFFDADTGAEIEVLDVGESSFQVGATRVTARLVNHVEGEPCLGWRLDSGGASLAYVPDVEYLEPQHRDPVADLAHNVDLLIHDAHYTADEHPAHCGLGHSCDADAVEMAEAAGARRLLLFHHHPDHVDGIIDAVVRSHRGRDVPVEAARQGAQIRLGSGG
ncbi:MAG: MBL fold metallo-hydrolase [Gemmatimonadota bacterium]